jgi:hypothetical protein
MGLGFESKRLSPGFDLGPDSICPGLPGRRKSIKGHELIEPNILPEYLVAAWGALQEYGIYG